MIDMTIFFLNFQKVSFLVGIQKNYAIVLLV